MGLFNDILRTYKRMTVEEAEQYIIEQAEESKCLKIICGCLYMIVCALVGVLTAIYIIKKYGG